MELILGVEAPVEFTLIFGDGVPLVRGALLGAPLI